MSNVRECKFCHKMVDFDAPWCDHETMEESAWLDIKARREQQIRELRDPNSKAYQDSIIDPLVHAAAIELGLSAAEGMRKMIQEIFDR